MKQHGAKHGTAHRLSRSIGREAGISGIVASPSPFAVAAAKPVPCPVSVAESGRQESADDYQHVVVRLNARWRVIECRDGIQWILQQGKSSGHGTAWRGRSYFRTRQALIRACARYAAEMEPSAHAILDALPGRIGNGGVSGA